MPADVPVTVIGVGSNLLVRDGGITGVVIRLDRGFAHIGVAGDEVRAGAVALDLKVSLTARDAGLAGLEFLSGIPGTIGGALRMNAGAYGREIKDVLIEAEALDAQRHAAPAHRRRAGLFLSPSRRAGGLDLHRRAAAGPPDDPAAIAARMAEIGEIARGLPAGPQPHRRLDLREPAGRQGVGADRPRRLPRADARQAQVSDKHSNFLINTGGATAADIEGLGEEVRRRVHASKLAASLLRMGNPPIVGVPLAGAAGDRCMSKTVAVLMGGWSSEREVSLSSGENVARALRRAGLRRAAASTSARPAAAILRRAHAAARRGVQRAARPLRRGRLHPGRARGARHALHPFRRARLGARHGQADGQDAVRRRRACPAPRAASCTRDELAQGRSDAAALRREADQRGLERRRASSCATATPRDSPQAAGRSATRCWSSATCPAASSPSP